MLGHGEYDRKFILALELGGKNLKDYYYEQFPRGNGGHHDIKYDNFIVSRNQHPNANVIDVKLIDFNLSNLYGHQVDVEKIQKNDIKKFGEMVYRIINEHYTRGAILFKNIFKNTAFFPLCF
uniref:Protein kinase domain-containing protein n=1 Tax=Meloidogyne javanica TaxID=6303 RepID=A0A915MFL3_MELJA